MGNLSLRDLCEGNRGGGGAALLVTPKDVLSKATEMDVCFHGVPAFGEQGGKVS